jgi:hypothetical protein
VYIAPQATCEWSQVKLLTDRRTDKTRNRCRRSDQSLVGFDFAAWASVAQMRNEIALTLLVGGSVESID